VVVKGFEITQAGDVIDKLFTYRDKYHEKGKYLGFRALHEHYSMSLGNCTDWSGFPMSGKTQFLMECLVNTSLMYGWKHLVYFPDVGSNVEIIADLIHKVTGKTFDPEKKNAITDQEITRSIDWITQHFKVLTKRDVKAKMTPFDLKGGSEWINSGKCQITIHREDITNNIVDVYFNKIKPRSNGNVGRIQMYFDIEKFVYYDEVGIHRTKVYAQKQ